MTASSMADPQPFQLSKGRLKPPSPLLLLAEFRAVGELALGLAALPLLAQAPRGDGHTVLVLPGFLAGDGSTALLRGFLDRMGFVTHPWGLGRNLGGVYRMRDKLLAKLEDVHQTSGKPVSLIGWSLGGVYSRALAQMRPDLVRYVITLGSPFANDVTATNAGRLYEMLSGESPHTAHPDDLAMLRAELPMPTSAIYTRRDGVVHWRTCLNPHENHKTENIEVRASHVGLGVNPAVLWAIADRLAQPAGSFKPFDRKGPFRLAYPR